MNPNRTRKMTESSRSPWLYFSIFLFFGALLSWLPFTFWQRFWLFPLGLILMLALAWQYASTAPIQSKLTFKQGFLRFPSFWIWAFLLASAAFMRFYRLVSLPLWPTWDDATISALSIPLAEHSQWSLFFGSQKLSPLFIWALALFFRGTEPSLVTLWFFPALLSITAVPLAWFAARRFFSPFQAFLLTLLAAFQFISLYDGRFCLSFAATFANELLLIWLFGRFLEANSKKTVWQHAVGLGIAVGLSLYLCIIFIPLVAFFTGAVAWACFRKKNRSWFPFLIFLFSFLAIALPIGVDLLKNIFSGHIATHLVFGHVKAIGLHQVSTFFSYLTVFFFGSIDRSYWAFGPLWGGYFNPVLDALFFLGLGEMMKRKKTSFFLGWSFAMFLCFIPSLFFNTVEFMRIRSALPFLLVPIAVGATTLVPSLPRKTRGLFLAFLLLTAFVWDGLHLFSAFGHWSATEAFRPGLAIKSYERYQAFRVLEAQNRKEGPGLVFSDFVSDVYDQSLLVSTYPFNAARNPRLDPTKARWAAILADLHYRQLIQKRYPNSRFFLLSDSSIPGDQILVMALIPLAGSQNNAFQTWIKPHHEIQDLYRLMPYLVENPDFKPVIGRLFSLYQKCEKDDLLKGWLLEKILDLLLVSEDITQAQWFLERPVFGLRSFKFIDLKFAQLFHRLGIALLKASEKDRARECFRRAALFDPHYDPKKYMDLCGAG
jgi:hypothetical protein